MDEQVYFQALLNEFGTRLYLDPQLRQIMKKIEQGKADFSDTAHLSERASNLLGEVFGANVADIPAEAREAVCTALLKDRYDSMNGTLAAVQEALDEPLGLHLTPQKAPFPSERVDQLAHSLVDPTVKPETIQRRADKPVATVAKSFHDDYIKTNARFRNRLGLKPVIKRFGVGCCQWCAQVAGTYRFGEQPEDVFRRHDNCGCVIIYDTQVLRGVRTADGGSSRAWTEVDPSDLQANPPASLSQQEARELERFARQRLTFAGERDIMRLDDIVIGRSVGSRARNYDIMDLQTGEHFSLAEGSRLRDVEVFAGKGVRTPYRQAEKFAEKYGGRPENWQHVKGKGEVDYYGDIILAELHWSQCEGIGKVEFFIKRWLE